MTHIISIYFFLYLKITNPNQYIPKVIGNRCFGVIGDETELPLHFILYFIIKNVLGFYLMVAFKLIFRLGEYLGMRMFMSTS